MGCRRAGGRAANQHGPQRERVPATDQWPCHASAPLVHIEKIGDSALEPLPPGFRLLTGVRALGMTHVVAGPVVLRQLAAAGPDCLNLNMPDIGTRG